MPGYLAIITSGSEKDFISSTFNVDEPDVWIGGDDRSSEGNWEWITGEAWSYEYWNGGEPNGGTDENCLTID